MNALDLSFSAPNVTPAWCASRIDEGYRLLVVDLWTGNRMVPGAEHALATWRSAGGIIAAYFVVHEATPAATHFARAKQAAGAEWEKLAFVAIDAEVSPCTSAVVREACDLVSAGGLRPIIYSAHWFWVGHMGNPLDCADLPFWEARYQVPPSLDAPGYGGWTQRVGHQHVNTTKLDGIHVDINVFSEAWVTGRVPLSGTWHAGDLSALTGAPPAAGDPHGYVNASDGTQHLVFRNSGGHVQELFWSEAAGWAVIDLTVAAESPLAAGDPAGYVLEADKSQHVVYRDGEGHVQELFWLGAGWKRSDLTVVSGAPAAVGEPSGYGMEEDASQHVVFRDDSGHVQELYWHDAAGWEVHDLTVTTGAPAAAGDPTGYVFRTEGTQHIVYRAGDSHIWELRWDSATGWHGEDLTAAAGALSAGGEPTAYSFEHQETLHVIFRDAEGQVQELYRNRTGWHANALSAGTEAPPSAGDPAAYAFEADESQHVFYYDATRHVQELYWDDAGWHAHDLTVTTGAAAPKGDPAAYILAGQNTQHVVYQGDEGHIHELWWG